MLKNVVIRVYDVEERQIIGKMFVTRNFIT